MLIKQVINICSNNSRLGNSKTAVNELIPAYVDISQPSCYRAASKTNSLCTQMVIITRHIETMEDEMYGKIPSQTQQQIFAPETANSISFTEKRAEHCQLIFAPCVRSTQHTHTESANEALCDNIRV